MQSKTEIMEKLKFIQQTIEKDNDDQTVSNENGSTIK